MPGDRDGTPRPPGGFWRARPCRSPGVVCGMRQATALLFPQDAELVHELSWSKSRHEKFKDCKRAYWFTYYGSWGGWEAPRGSEVRELYVLKKLSSRWQWAGSVVHRAVKDVLDRARATGDFLSVDRVLERTHARARAEWASSRDKSYWHEPSRIVGLVEHEYGEVVPDAEWRRLWTDTVEASLRALWASSTWAEIRSTPASRWLTVDALDEWRFEGTRVWLALDFAYRDAEGRVHVLDWKTGKERGVDHVQVGTYALYAGQKWGVAPDGVVGDLVYLVPPDPGAAAERVSVAVDPSTLDACRTEMRASIAAMRAALADPERNVARKEDFPQLSGREACARCPFRRPCGRI